MAGQTLTIEIDPQTAAALTRAASERHISIEQLAREAVVAHAAVADAPLPAWSAEDLAAIDEGIAQLDRGEFFTQEEVEAHIDALLRE